MGKEEAIRLHEVDVVCSSDASHFIYWKRDGLLASYVPEDVTRHFPPERIDPDAMYASTFALLSPRVVATHLALSFQARAPPVACRPASRCVSTQGAGICDYTEAIDEGCAFLYLALVAASVCLAAASAHAHPHVRVTMTEELLYAPDGSSTGVRHAWTFDDMFSAFATQGLEQKTKGTFTREELAPLAKVNIRSLKDYAYFTYAKVNGKRQKEAFGEPVDYWLGYNAKDAVLTLHFTLPFNKPVRAGSARY
jgi:hypothetical protein